MKTKDIGFFAYPSEPKSCGDAIEAAVKEINNDEIEIKTWRSMKISGKVIVSKILAEIDACDFFCADLTGINDNVLFELGYAITKKKPLFIINDTSHGELYRRFKELSLFVSTGYIRYTNTADIVRGFEESRPYDSVDKLLWDTLLETMEIKDIPTPLLILNGQVNTNYNQDIVSLANTFKLPFILDDASESKVQPLSWYASQLNVVPAVLAQFSTTSRVGSEVHNAKCAVVCGMALGLGKKVRMISESPYETPLDYRELLQVFETREKCKSIVNNFFTSVRNEMGQFFLLKEQSKPLKKLRSTLQDISFGEAIAEHENLNLSEYYVPNANTNSLIKNEYNLVIGRKGTGKTASLYFLQNYLKADKKNHVVVIKPITFEVDGLISLMESSQGDFERGFLVECIWKFLIYTEIAKHLYEEINKKPMYALTKEEEVFSAYIESSPNIFLSDFSTRLEEQLKVLRENRIVDIPSGSNQEYRIKVSEFLHQGTLATAREHFAKIIPKNHNLIVLIDNLDKSWRPNSRINILSKYILGLLGVSGRIVGELSVIKSIKMNLSFRLTLFLRSDIFRYVVMYAREPDKIEVTRLQWDDKESLFRIIEERFKELSGIPFEGSELWDHYICKSVGGVDVKDYIMDSVFPRPRDIIFFFKSAKDIAVSRGHSRIEEEDIKKAHRNYSAWVFQSLIAENGITLKQMEDFMYELMASDLVLTQSEIVDKMIRAKIDTANDDSIEKFIDYLVSLTILGRETKAGVFEYEYDDDKSKKLKILSEKLNSKRYRIHNALVPYLEVNIN